MYNLNMITDIIENNKNYYF